MICQDCGKEYDKWLPEGAIENNRCPSCNETGWKQWEIEQSGAIFRIRELEQEGHTNHCACRIVWGDGECECQKHGIIPGNLSRLIIDSTKPL